MLATLVRKIRHGLPGTRNVLGTRLDPLGEPVAVCDHVLREAERRPFLRALYSTGQHHVHHAGCADQAWDAHRATADDEDAVHALGEGVIGTAFGHPDMRGGRQFQAAADDGTVQDDDHGDLTVFDLLESTVPGT